MSRGWLLARLHVPSSPRVPWPGNLHPRAPLSISSAVLTGDMAAMGLGSPVCDTGESLSPSMSGLNEIVCVNCLAQREHVLHSANP